MACSRIGVSTQSNHMLYMCIHPKHALNIAVGDVMKSRLMSDTLITSIFIVKFQNF